LDGKPHAISDSWAIVMDLDDNFPSPNMFFPDNKYQGASDAVSKPHLSNAVHWVFGEVFDTPGF